MATRLERFVNDCRPARLSDPVYQAADEALMRFGGPPGDVITSHSRFADLFIRFLNLVVGCIAGRGGPFPGSAQQDWGRCVRAFRGIYGAPNGEKTAFEIARTGKGDALNGLLRKFAYEVARQYVENQIRAIISAYWNSLSVEEKLTVPDEYLAKHGHLLPSELREAGLGRVHAEFPRVLEAHARMLNRARGLPQS